MSNTLKIENVKYSYAIEAKSKLYGLPNLHMLVAKLPDERYMGLCLETDYSCWLDATTDNIDTILDNIFVELCVGSVNQFYFCHKKNKDLFLSSRITAREYWDIYDELFLPLKQKKLASFFDVYQMFEAVLDKNGALYEKASINETKKSFSNSIDFDMSVLLYNLLKKSIEAVQRGVVAHKMYHYNTK